MRELVRSALVNPIVRQTALGLIGSMYAQTKMDYVRGVERYARDNVKIVDENDEILNPPDRMIGEIREQGYSWGDCDDAAMLTAALLVSLGVESRFKAVWPHKDGSYQHVFTEYKLGAFWYPMDTTISFAPVYPPDFLIESV